MAAAREDAKRRTGRPRKADAERRSVQLNLRLRPADAAAVERAARRRQQTLVDFARGACLAAAADEEPVALDRRLALEEQIATRGALIRIAGELARLGQAVTDKELRDEVASVRSTIARVVL